MSERQSSPGEASEHPTARTGSAEDADRSARPGQGPSARPVMGSPVPRATDGAPSPAAEPGPGDSERTVATPAATPSLRPMPRPTPRPDGGAAGTARISAVTPAPQDSAPRGSTTPGAEDVRAQPEADVTGRATPGTVADPLGGPTAAGRPEPGTAPSTNWRTPADGTVAGEVSAATGTSAPTPTPDRRTPAGGTTGAAEAPGVTAPTPAPDRWMPAGGATGVGEAPGATPTPTTAGAAETAGAIGAGPRPGAEGGPTGLDDRAGTGDPSGPLGMSAAAARTGVSDATMPVVGAPVAAAPAAAAGDDDRTREIPRVTGPDAARPQAVPDPRGAAPTAVTRADGPGTGGPGDGGSGGDGPGGDGPGGDRPAGHRADGPGRGRRRGLLIAGAVLGVLVLVYLADLFLSSGTVPRGVIVAGQPIGGLSRAAAVERLQAAIEPRSTQPVQVTAGEVRSEIDPKAAGLAIDYPGTLDRAGAQPLNPITRITSLFTDRDVPVVNTADERSVRTALDQLAPVVDRAPKDGSVRFDGLNPVPVAPQPGQHLDVTAAVDTLERQWATGVPVALPLIIEQPATTPDDVRKAIDEIARPAVSGPLTVTGEGANATVKPEDIAASLSFRPVPDGPVKLVPQFDVGALTDATKPQLASTEKPGVDASVDLAVTPPRIVPSVDGRGIDYKATFANVAPAVTAAGPRRVAAVYAPKPADITTQEIQSLGNASEISTFTTGGFARDSGINIRRAAEAIDGKIVAPGETFSLNGATDPRDASTGYVDAGIIEDGHPSRGVGGGVSQLATTLYNASYFAGMVDVEHKEHSYYISRYPAGREATVFENLIDVKFRNDGPTAVMIRTVWTPSTITVKFVGQKQYDVTSRTGPRTNITPPQVVTIPPGQQCSRSNGSPGFTTTDTRTVRNIATGEVTTRTRTVRYNPQPIVRCG